MNVAELREYRQRLSDDKASYFSDWPVSLEIRVACWKNLVETVDSIIALGPEGSAEDATAILGRCIERYNELDEGFICTIEREDLCTILYEIGNLCGLDSKADWVDQWREW
jgi:hypothetical protein